MPATRLSFHLFYFSSCPESETTGRINLLRKFWLLPVLSLIDNLSHTMHFYEALFKNEGHLVVIDLLSFADNFVILYLDTQLLN